MRKIQILGLALVAMFAFSAIAASLASAETTLLAVWLLNGTTEVAANTAATGTGELQLEDTKVGLGVLCKGSFVGTVGVNGAQKIETVLNAESGEVSLTKELACEGHKGCEAGTDIAVAPEELPWIVTAFLKENGTFSESVAKAGYFTECLVLGIKVSETCTATNAANEILNVTGGVEVMGIATPLANCTTGGTGAGLVEFQATNLLAVSGSTLSISSE